VAYYEAKVDSKGRIVIPPEVRRELQTDRYKFILIRRTPVGFILERGKGETFFERFRKLIVAEPERTGRPLNQPSPRARRARKKR